VRRPARGKSEINRSNGAKTVDGGERPELERLPVATATATGAGAGAGAGRTGGGQGESPDEDE
jgi:hypothetical protein